MSGSPYNSALSLLPLPMILLFLFRTFLPQYVLRSDLLTLLYSPTKFSRLSKASVANMLSTGSQSQLTKTPLLHRTRLAILLATTSFFAIAVAGALLLPFERQPKFLT